MQSIMDEERTLREEMSRLCRELEACDQLRALAEAAETALAIARQKTESAKNARFFKAIRLRIAKAHLKDAAKKRRHLVRKAARKAKHRPFIERELNDLRREYVGPVLSRA